MKAIFEVTISRMVRETATFCVKTDHSVDVDMVDTDELANAVYEAESGEVTWQIDTDYCEQGMCTAERVIKLREPDVLADVRDAGIFLEVKFR